jgi:hypothetical protein
MRTMPKKREEKGTQPGKPLSLEPLSFEEAVSDLLKVKSEPKHKAKKEAEARIFLNMRAC